MLNTAILMLYIKPLHNADNKYVVTKKRNSTIPKLVLAHYYENKVEIEPYNRTIKYQFNTDHSTFCFSNRMLLSV